MILKGKAALVTGSTSGIGKATALALAAEGAALMINGFGEAAEIEALLARLRELSGAPARHHPADAARPAEVAALAAEAERALGSVDVLVNNAGVQHVSPVEEFPPEQWDRILAVNLSAAFHAVRAVLPGMRRRGWGRIVNIASAHGLVASAGKAAYVAAKHGLVGLTKVVALETAASPVTCNAICPGWVLTPLVVRQIAALAEREGVPEPEARRRLLAEKQPSLQFVAPEDVGAAAVFLCSPAAAQMRGASLSLDGGWTAQ